MLASPEQAGLGLQDSLPARCARAVPVQALGRVVRERRAGALARGLTLHTLSSRRTSTACTIRGTGPTMAQRPPTPTTTATPSRSGPAPGRATAQTGRLPGRGLLRATMAPSVDGAARATTPATTAASTTMEIRAAGTGTPMGLGSGTPAPTTAGTGMTRSTSRTGKTATPTLTGPRGTTTPGGTTLASQGVLTTTLSPTGTRTGTRWTGAACTASTRGRACAVRPACTAATAASAPTRSRVRFTGAAT